jgi:hypothetical protein
VAPVPAGPSPNRERVVVEQRPPSIRKGMLLGAAIAALGAAVLSFVSVPVGAIGLLFGIAVIAGATIYPRAADPRVLELDRDGVTIYREFYDFHEGGLRLAWSDIAGVALVQASTTRWLRMPVEEVVAHVERLSGRAVGALETDRLG